MRSRSRKRDLRQPATFWNGFHGERGYAPIHVYETETQRPVDFILSEATLAPVNISG